MVATYSPVSGVGFSLSVTTMTSVGGRAAGAAVSDGLLPHSAKVAAAAREQRIRRVDMNCSGVASSHPRLPRVGRAKKDELLARGRDDVARPLSGLPTL